MKLPKFKLEVKLIAFFVIIAIVPLIIVNIIWLQSLLSNTLTVENRIGYIIILVTITLIVVVGLSIWLASRIVNPIRQLQEASAQLGVGNLDYRVNIHTGDELEYLSNGFNTMADNLKKSIMSLRSDREIISAERNKLAIVLSGITDAVVAVDMNHNIVIFNSAAVALTGYKEIEVLGKSISQIISVYDEERLIPSSEYCPTTIDSFEGVVFNKKNLRLIGAGNKNTYVDIIVGKIKEGPKINLGCILAFHDITKEKSLEDMKLDFVSMAAHELRTPLTSLKGYLSVFMQDNKDKFNAEQTMFLNRMNISSSQLSSLVENLLSVSRIERGAFSIHSESLDWVESVREAVNNIRDRAKDKKIDLQFVEPATPMPRVSADKLRIVEVLTNLIANAIAYTTSGGTVTVSIEQKDKELITHVKDTGQGIPKEALPKLFTKFFRVSGPLEQGSKGTGLGLYISKAIVDMHHGKIWVESEYGKGSTFSFALTIIGQDN